MYVCVCLRTHAKRVPLFLVATSHYVLPSGCAAYVFDISFFFFNGGSGQIVVGDDDRKVFALVTVLLIINNDCELHHSRRKPDSYK